MHLCSYSHKKQKKLFAKCKNPTKKLKTYLFQFQVKYIIFHTNETSTNLHNSNFIVLFFYIYFLQYKYLPINGGTLKNVNFTKGASMVHTMRFSAELNFLVQFSNANQTATTLIFRY